MIIYDSAYFVSAYLKGEKGAFLKELSSSEEGILLLHSTLSEIGDSLEIARIPHDDIASYLASLIAVCGPMDSTICLLACTVYSKAPFPFSSCLLLAYAALGNNHIHFEDQFLEKYLREDPFLTKLANARFRVVVYPDDVETS